MFPLGLAPKPDGHDLQRQAVQVLSLQRYARSWAAEIAPRRICVNVVATGPTDTDMMAAVSDEMRQMLIAPIPLGRMARADEVAAAAVLLLSEATSFVTAPSSASIAACGRFSRMSAEGVARRLTGRGDHHVADRPRSASSDLSEPAN